MSRQFLRMKYHPAKKEVMFIRVKEDGREVEFSPGDRLWKYISKKGSFVLQDHGKPFFDDIADAFDGLDSLKIEVITTKLDYADFEQMVERYNPEGKCRLTTTLIAELPDMNVTFEQVKRHGEESISILRNRCRDFYNIDSEAQSVKEAADSFVLQVNEAADGIQKKIDSLGDSNVSLCFAGVYSSGKSALINAILGYRILPENISSETAKMFVIRSPLNGKPVSIEFELPKGHCELEWSEGMSGFEFVKGTYGDALRKEIQIKLNDLKEQKLRQFEQVNAVLDLLNKKTDVSDEIDVYFPVPLDSEKVQFTIYDTPGTDSNYLQHKVVLEEALAEQRQSILIFVAKPDGLEGEGNNALLSYIKEAEKKDNKTTIDIGRSLFVINKADGQTKNDRTGLQTEKIKSKTDSELSIRLEDKKLFFTSARYAYSAKAKTNGIDSEQDRKFIDKGMMMFCQEGDEDGFVYRDDRCATSQVATENLISRSDDAFGRARERGDRPGMVLVASGLYALEEEIKTYGEKYASAVRAYAIIDRVDKALASLNNSVNSLRHSADYEISKINEETKNLRDSINKAVDSAYRKYALPKEGQLPKETLKYLGLDEDSQDGSFINNTIAYLDKELRGRFFGLGMVKFKEDDKQKVKDRVGEAVRIFTDSFLKKREKLLEERGTAFMEEVKSIIRNNGDISPAAKKEFLSIPESDVKRISAAQIAEYADIYDHHKRVDRVLWVKLDHLDKEEFLDDLATKLQGVKNDMSDDYKRDYKVSLAHMLDSVKGTFLSQLDRYSVRMKALIDDREAMKDLGAKVAGMAEELEASQGKLNNIIWEAKENDR